MAFEEFQNRAEPNLSAQKDGSQQTFLLFSPVLIAILVAAGGGTRLLMEFLPLWAAILIAAPAAILIFGIVIWISGGDIMDLWVISAIMIILTLMLVPALLNRMHHDKTVPDKWVPAAAQKPN